jgi:chaperonin GroEL (HSP60 family)
MAAKSVARLMRSSMGPKGMDKMMQSPDGDILISGHCRHIFNVTLLACCSTCS